MATGDGEAERNWIVQAGIDKDESALPDLVAVLLGDGDEMSRRRAAVALGGIGSSDAVPALVRAVQGSEPDVRQLALHALAKAPGPAALPVLHEVLHSSSKRFEKYAAARAIAAIADDQADEMLLEAVNHPDRHVCQIALKGMSRRPTPRARTLLEIAATRARTRRRRFAARMQLTLLDDRPAEVPVLDGEWVTSQFTVKAVPFDRRRVRRNLRQSAANLGLELETVERRQGLSAVFDITVSGEPDTVAQFEIYARHEMSLSVRSDLNF